MINIQSPRPAGLPEARVLPLPGRGNQIELRAHLLGTRIDMRALIGFGGVVKATAPGPTLAIFYPVRLLDGRQTKAISKPTRESSRY
ncbi:hypothetical protein ACMGDM_18760 [Sphingomonas sp. DT-51]|uniref:hypothetical protein n=1 Tax=Sphingomonas sp. DT-51 TaxID=3396165 RepID=UPI003F1A0269